MTRAHPTAGGLSRRRLLGVAALGGSTLAVAGAGVGYAAKSNASDTAPSTAGPVPFYGAHQAGIATPAQDRLAFQKNAHTQFVPLQTRLGSNDALNEYITHTSSALFAVPPGPHAVGDWFGRRLFQS